MKQLISVIIPVYNHEKELKKALASIFNQTCKDLEVIVVDDGSKPGMRLTKYDIRLVRQDHKGAPAARNRGLKEAKGEYVIFWDADVVAMPEMLEKMHNVLQENRKASFAYSNFRFGWKKFTLRHFSTTALKHDNYIHSTSLIRKKDVIQWDESLKRLQDWDYWLTMSEHGKSGVWINEFLFKVIPGGTMSTWLPKFVYKKPWKFIPGIKDRVSKYEKTRQDILAKHKVFNFET